MLLGVDAEVVDAVLRAWLAAHTRVPERSVDLAVVKTGKDGHSLDQAALARAYRLVGLKGYAEVGVTPMFGCLCWSGP